MTEVGGRRVECVHPGHVAIWLGIGIAVLSSIALAFLVADLVRSGLDAMPAVVLAGAYTAMVVLVVRHRMRTMGRFVVDGTLGELRRIGGSGDVIATHPLAEVRFDTRWDPFDRGSVFQHWVIASCGARAYRLGKGDKDRATAVCARLEAIRDAWIEEHEAAYRD